MNKISETFVIVRQFEYNMSFFQEHISFNKEEIDLKCEELNKQINEEFEKNSKKNKIPFMPITVFLVLSLDKAIEMFKDNVQDYYTEQDASY